jgi:photosystem II stability/assembly factor-like uncharacterized protein
MRSGATSASWRLLLLVATAMMLWSAVVLAKDDPKIAVNKFDNYPSELSYFEDSDVILFIDRDDTLDGHSVVYRSEDAGFSWEEVEAISQGEASMLIMHRFDTKTAFVLTEGATHYKTTDRGKTWTTFDTTVTADMEDIGVPPTYFLSDVLVFHSDDPDRVIFNGMICEGIFCSEIALYTTDGFKRVRILRNYTSGCWWAKNSYQFTTGDKDLDRDRTVCIVPDALSFFTENQRLHVSDSFFEVSNDDIDEFEPDMDDEGHGVDGVVNLAIVKNFLLVATKSINSDEMALYITNDTIKWHRAMFPKDDSHDHSHQIYQEAYTVLESTNYSVQVDVMTSHPSRPMGVLFTSNSDGFFFIENIPYTNRDDRGHVDFEQIAGIQGVYLVNVVENGKDVDESGENKKVVTRITYDDGRNFEPIKSDSGDSIHLHSETELDNAGRVFSSPAPGLVMGNGNTGKYLREFAEADLFVSDDAGLTWTKALEGPHKYEFGDTGSILLAISDSAREDVGEFKYSLDHGKNWDSVSLPDDLKVRPAVLTTTQDSTSLKFLLIGVSDELYYTIAIDFEGLDKRTCESKDMEDWHARIDEDGNPTCVMGHKQTYSRRKKDADCFMRADFKDPEPQIDNCECSDDDFECDFNFQRSEDRSECVKVGPIARPDGVCDDDREATFMGSSGWRLIPGNTCTRGSGAQKDDLIERKCSDAVSAPNGPGSGKVDTKEHIFQTNLQDIQKFYLEKGTYSSGDEDTVIARPIESRGEDRVLLGDHVWVSHDHGKNWEEILKGQDIYGIFPHPHFNEMVFFSTSNEKVIYTVDRGHSFHTFEAPTPPGDSLPLKFHPDRKDWLLWIGKSCDGIGESSCYHEASLSIDRGDNWRTILRYVERCEFTGNSLWKTSRPLKQIVCLAHEEENTDSDWTVVTSDDFFEEHKSYFEGGVTNFATMSEFIVLAGVDSETSELHAFSSLDGKNFEQAHFPHNFHEGHNSKYTVLDSSTHAINLFVQTEGASDREYGSIVKSNSNGTSYVVSASHVNCDENVFVDFEKVPGLEGLALINVVTNADREGDRVKSLQTKISHNDGNKWGFLPPPERDVNGDKYECHSQRGDESCALHIHHYTEREDKRKTFAAGAAVGLMLGVGNVGSKLGDIEDADTFLTTDAGITWTNVKKGRWTWQYGDQGSIIVLAQKTTRNNPVKSKAVSYSLDEGKTWEDQEFATVPVTVLDITTVQSGTSRNFLVWCRDDAGTLFSVNLDFSGLADDACEVTEDDNSDYYLWSPKHPLQDNDCLFGHVAKYLRKKPDRKCYNKENLQRLQQVTNCECTREDYEW